MSYTSISSTFPETLTPIINVKYNNITTCCINYSMVIRSTNIEYFGTAIVTKRITLLYTLRNLYTNYNFNEILDTISY